MKGGLEVSRLAAAIESYAAQCRRAATQIRRIEETLPKDRYRGQREMLLLVAESLDEQAVGITIEGRILDHRSLRTIARLGRDRVAKGSAVLTALGTLVIAGVGVVNEIENTEHCFDEIERLTVELDVGVEALVALERTLSTEEWEEARRSLRGMARALFSPADFVSGSAESLTIRLPNQRHRDKALEHLSKLEEALASVTGRDVTVEIVAP